MFFHILLSLDSSQNLTNVITNAKYKGTAKTTSTGMCKTREVIPEKFEVVLGPYTLKPFVMKNDSKGIVIIDEINK